MRNTQVFTRDKNALIPMENRSRHMDFPYFIMKKRKILLVWREQRKDREVS